MRWERASETRPDLRRGLEQPRHRLRAARPVRRRRKAYEKALELDPNNTLIRNNYDLFREIYDRQNRRRGR